MRSIRILIMCLVLVTLLLPLGAMASQPGDETVDTIGANPMPPRDPVDLAIRFQGLDPAVIDFAPRPAYQVGDFETFSIGGSDGTEVRSVDMVLAASADNVYLWFERGLAYDENDVQEIAQIISERVIPFERAVFGTEKDVEGDPHIYVLNVNSAGFGIAGLFNDTDRFPNEVLPSSNEINSLIMAVSPNSPPYYLSVFAHEFQHLVQADLDDTEETWFIEGFAELGSMLALPEYFDHGRQSMYVTDFSGIQLNSWADGQSSVPYYGGASLFLAYITQQYGQEWVTLVASEPTDDMLGIDQAFQRLGAVDSQTGEVVTADDAFADFVVANYLNDPSLADGRYGYSLVNVREKAPVNHEFSSFPVDLSGSSVNQYGAQYILLESDSPQPLSIDFQGQESVELLPMQPYSGDYFYWSQRGNQGDSRLTGRFDLSNVSRATLNFKTWYSIEEFWDYGYISISTDNGASWQVLTTPDMTAENPYDRAFASGYTNVSGSGETRPAPFIGFGFGDGLAVVSIVPDTPAATGGMQIGDVLFAINGEVLTQENFFAVLDQYAPGQQITLTINRNGVMQDLDITPVAHPERTVEPDAAWQDESIDLTPYTGGEVLIRFDYVTDQATSLPGWVLDDVAIPEIGFFDDMENPGAAWASEGWVRISNAVPQNYIVQLIQYGDGLNISRLLEPGAGSGGTWSLDIGPNRRAVLVISGIAPITREPALFDLRITAN